VYLYVLIYVHPLSLPCPGKRKTTATTNKNVEKTVTPQKRQKPKSLDGDEQDAFTTPSARK